jgi:hypothetical protein
MSGSAWWMLVITWSVILFFSGRFLWRVVRLDPGSASSPSEEDREHRS